MTQIQTKFKQTEIGLIPEDWEVVELGKVSDINTGFPFKGEKYSSDGIRVLRGENVSLGFLRWDTDKRWNFETIGLEKYFLQENDVVIGMDGSRVGKNKSIVKKADLPLLLAQRVARLRGNKYLDQGFLRYLIISDIFEKYVEKIKTGTSIPHISGGQISSFEIPLSPLPEQKAIAEILSSLDDKIELLEKQNKTLENIGQALFKSWFVDFEPFKNDLVESEMGMIPRGWKVGKVGDFANIKSGFAFKSEDFSDEGINIIKIKNINDGYIDLKDVDKVDDSKLPNRAFDFELVEGDILVAMSGNTTGKIAMMPKFDGQFLLNQRAGKFFMKDEKNTGFIYFYLKANNIGALILQTAYGSAQPNISGKDIENFDLIIPRDEVLEKFSITSNDLIKKINTNIYQIQTLSNLRDTLLPRLMNGKIRVV